MTIFKEASSSGPTSPPSVPEVRMTKTSQNQVDISTTITQCDNLALGVLEHLKS